MHAMGSAVSSGVHGVLGFFRNLPGNIRHALGNMGSLLVSAGRDVVSGLGNGIRNAMSGLLDTVRNMGSQIANAAKSALGIHSPSRVFRDQVGRQVVAGLAEGITGNAGLALDAMSGVAGRLPDAVDARFGVRSSVGSFTPYGRYQRANDKSVVVNVNGPTYGDPNEFAKRIERQQRDALNALAYM